MGKKKQDAVSDFFGEDDDMDWLDAPSEEVSKSAIPEAIAPEAPVSSDVESVDDSPTTRVPPSGFGDLLPEPLGTSGPLTSLPEADPPTLEVDPTSEEVPIEMLDVLIQPSTAEVVDMAASDPADAEEDAEPETEVAPKPERSTAPPVERWEPASDADAWREAALALVSEAAQSEADRGTLLFEAARIYRTRLGDDEGAWTLLNDAVRAGRDDAAVHELRMQTALALDDLGGAVSAAESRAKRLEGAACADAWRDVATLAGDDGERAIVALRSAVDADPTDFLALSDLAVLLRGDDDLVEDLVYTLGQMAEISWGPAAAEIHGERAALLSWLGRDRDAQACWEAARKELPSHQPSLVALSKLFRDIGKPDALAALYETEARREGQPDPGHWLWLSARALRDAGHEDDADARYKEAAQAGSAQAAREHVAWLDSAGRHEALVDALKAQVAVAGDADRPFVTYRLARALEAAGDADGALAAYRDVATADGESRPAAAAVERVLRARGDSEGLRAFWTAQLGGDLTPATRTALLYRIGEEAESAGDQDVARASMEALLEVDAGFIPAIEALQRIYTRQASWAELAALHERRAALTVEKVPRALFLHRAGSTHQHRLDDLDAAQKFYEEALKLVPDQAPSLDALLGLLELKEDWKALSMRLYKAGQAATHESSKVSFLYRASRVLVDRVGNPKKAQAILKQVLDLSPDFVPARALLRDLAGPSGDYALISEEAATATGRAREWMLLGAADAAWGVKKANPIEHLLSLLEQNPLHAAALAELERSAVKSGDLTVLADAYERALGEAQDEEDIARYGTALADLFVQIGKAGKAKTLLERLATEAASQPLSALAAGHGHHKAAFTLLAGLEEPGEALARARYQAELDPSGALAALPELFDSPVGAAAASLALRLGATGNERVSALVVQAREEGPVGAAAMLQLLASAHDVDEARLDQILQASPCSTAAFRHLREVHMERSNVDGVRALYATYRPTDTAGLASTLEAMGEPAMAAAVWGQAEGLAALTHKERLLAAGLDWMGVFHAIEAQEAIVTDVAFLTALGARKRWVLATHLAETEEAWVAYRALHEANPDDRGVTRALARIAGKRGDTQLGIQYLRELAENAEGAEESASYQREIGGVYEDASNIPDARQAYLDALDYVRDDTEAIAGLKRLAEAEEDWAGLVQVLQREAGLVGQERKVEVLREIATLTEERLSDPALAIDRWRALLEESGGDVEALERTVALAEDTTDWALFVDAGAKLADQRTGRERASLLRRVGVVAEEQLGRQDAEQFYTAALEAAPDEAAARRLEKVRRRTGDWSGAVQMLVMQAEAAATPAEKVIHLAEAARIEAMTRHDAAAASALYLRLLEWDPDHHQALLYQSEYLFSDSSFDEALPVYSRLEKQLNDDDMDFEDFDVRMEVSGFFYRYAELLRAAGRSEDALQRYQRALDLNPTHIPSLEAVGPLYMQRRDFKRGQAVWRQLLQLTGGHGEKSKIAHFYTQLGLVEHALNNSEKAYKRFSKALELHPDHVGALKGMATLLEASEDWNNLLNVYNNIIYHATSSQDVVDAYLTKGRILDERLGRPDKASQHYDRLLAFDANQPRALLRLGEVRAREEDWSRAENCAERGLRVAKNPTPLRATLALLHAVSLHAQQKTEDSDEAWQIAQSADSTATEGLTGVEDRPAALARLHERLED